MEFTETAGRRRGLLLVAAAAAAAAAVSMIALSQDASATAMPQNAAAVNNVAPAVVPAVPALPAAPAAQVPGLSSVGKIVTGAAPAAVAPAAPAAGAHSVDMPPAAVTPCTGLDAAVAAFMQHFYAAHLEEGLGQQLGDLTNLDQYVKTHTVLIENMIKPSVGGSDAALGVFLQHVYAAHLETSPGQQVTDLSNLDQYVKTHTVLIENMLKPLSGSNVTSC
ncbi:hypothetical protein [Fodinicola feengrottensis]